MRPRRKSAIAALHAQAITGIRLRLRAPGGVRHLQRRVIGRVTFYALVPTEGGGAADDSPAEKGNGKGHASVPENVRVASATGVDGVAHGGDGGIQARSGVST